MQDIAPEQRAELIEAELESVLAGSSFRTSQQCQSLLRYIVENSVAHHDEMLRERVIGMSVFGRAPDYDTGNDPVVRARAAEVRKRLAQHYQQHDHVRQAIRIEIPVGSYRAVFETLDSSGLGSAHLEANNVPERVAGLLVVETERISASLEGEYPSVKKDSPVEQATKTETTPPQMARANWIRRSIALALTAILLLGTGLLIMRQLRTRHQQNEFDAFWAPIIDKERPVLICTGANHTYDLSKDFLDRYKAQHHVENVGVEFFIDLKKGEKLDEGELLPNNWLIGFGDVAAAARIASQLTKLNQSYQIRYGNEITVSDLHSSHAILIGGFSNPWTLELLHKLPIRLESRADGDFIVDTQGKTRVWRNKDEEGTFRNNDYAVISRVLNSETGNSDLVIAGIGTSANEAASNFLSDPDQLSTFLKKLPEGWEQKNMQIVLHVLVVKNVPVSTNVETFKQW